MIYIKDSIDNVDVDDDHNHFAKVLEPGQMPRSGGTGILQSLNIFPKLISLVSVQNSHRDY